MIITSELPCVVIATALPVEFKAVLTHLEDPRIERHEAGTVYESGIVRLGAQTWRVGVVQTGPRNPRAAFEIERAVSHFRPSHVFFVGVAGALKDVEIGDVVAATKVYDTEGGKADAVYRPRSDFGQSSYTMQQLAHLAERQGTWRERIRRFSTYNNQLRPHPEVIVGPIASGENVVSNTKSDVYKFLKHNCSDALAVEMEGFGFLATMHANEKIAALLVRGISDLIDDKTGADRSGSQEVASANAAAFAMDVLSRVQVSQQEIAIEVSEREAATSQLASGNRRVTINDGLWRQLNGLAAGLYQGGPEENHVWVRSGGDLASIERHAVPKASWYSALWALEMGGGGAAITLEQLLRTMSEDFPQNPELEQFKKEALGI